MRKAIFPLLLLLLPLDVTAETFRCGQWVISSDITVDELAQKCGEPTTREIRTEDIYARTQYGIRAKTGDTTTIETWTYDRGPRESGMVVTIVDGKIRKITRKPL